MERDQDQGAVFRSLRELCEWSPEEMAEVAGVTVEEVADYERGVRIPSPEVMRRITDKLGVPESVTKGFPGSGRTAGPAGGAGARRTDAGEGLPASLRDLLETPEEMDEDRDVTREYRREAAQRRDQGHPGMAMERLDFALHIGRDRDKAWVLAQRAALLLSEWGDTSGALEALRGAVRAMDEHGEPRDRAAVRLQQAAALCTAGQPAAAGKALAEAKRLSAALDDRLRLGLRWLEGRVEAARGGTGKAAAALAEVRDGLDAAGRTVEASLASVELAVLHAVQGDLGKAAAAAERALPALEARKGDREPLGIVKLLRRLAQAGTLTPERARSLLQDLARTPTGRALGFEATPG